METRQKATSLKGDARRVRPAASESGRKSSNNDVKIDRAQRELFRVIARRCHGKTVILGPGAGSLAKSAVDRGVDLAQFDLRDPSMPGGRSQSPDLPSMPCDIGELALPEEGSNTVVLLGVLGLVSEEACPEILSEAWRLLRPGGRLIVSVPNGDCVPRANGVRPFSRHRLTKLLRSLGKPRLVTDQPLRWLLMCVQKDGSAARRPNRTWKQRFRATAGLCRGSVIELGCGEGHLTKAISDRGLEAMGVDMNEAKIGLARQAYPAIDFIQSDIRELTLPPESFDTVLLAEVLEHVSKDVCSEFLSKARLLLKANGRLIVSVPNEDCIPHPHHIRQFTRRDLKRLLQPLGRPRLVTDQPFKWLLMYVDRTS